MPIYLYKNPNTGEVTEHLLPMEHDPPIVEEPDVKGVRVFSPPAIKFVGMDWPSKNLRQNRKRYQQDWIDDIEDGIEDMVDPRINDRDLEEKRRAKRPDHLKEPPK